MSRNTEPSTPGIAELKSRLLTQVEEVHSQADKALTDICATSGSIENLASLHRRGEDFSFSGIQHENTILKRRLERLILEIGTIRTYMRRIKAEED